MNFLSLLDGGQSSDVFLYGHKEWWSAYSGFALDEKNTLFSVLAVLYECMNAIQETHLERC